MQTRRYYADSVTEGLMAVHSELGSNAMILSVQELKNPPAGKPRQVEILASAPQKEKGQPEKSAIKAKLEALTSTNPAKPSVDTEPKTETDGKNGKAEEQLLADLYAAQANIGKASAQRNAPIESPRDSGPSIASASGNSSVVMESRQEHSDWQNRKSRDDSYGRGTADLFGPQASALYFYLLDIGIEQPIAEEMVGRLNERMNPKKGWQKEKIKEFLGSLIARQIRVGGLLRPSRRRRIAAVVGPTGVGKTTTIAKLVTRLARQKVSVGVVTVDHYRVGAVDQIKKFTQVVNVPTLVATNRRELISSLRAFRSRQFVLIDTQGQNPRDIDLLERLDRTLKVEDPVERHLVLSAATKERDLSAYIELYNHIGFDFLLFSKLDETATYGGMLNSYFAANRPFSYFTTGQRVPEDIEEANSNRLNELLFH